MTDEPFLIAHKVRGEAAFDIAIKMVCPICTGTGYNTEKQDDCHECQEGFWWICSTSGHRAYPYWNTKIHGQDGLMDCAFADEDFIPTMPLDWPDHYQCDIDRDLEKLISRDDVNKAFTLLESLGLAKKPTPIARRV